MEWYQTGNLDVSCSLGNIETGVEGPRPGLCAPIKVRACVQVCNFFGQVCLDCTFACASPCTGGMHAEKKEMTGCESANRHFVASNDTGHDDVGVDT